VHVPFCIKKCPYCAFYKELLGEDKETIFLTNILAEIQLYAQRYGVMDVDTIFFGGGTPNILKRSTFSKIMAHIHTNFNVSSNAEITMEMNPGVHSKSKLSYFLSEGINRVSVGVQSFDAQVLQDYGRNHSVPDTYQFLEDLQSVGIKNVNVDIIFGHPNHLKKTLKHSLDIVSNMKFPHVSLYGLTLYPGTPFYKQNLNINQDSQGEQYRYIQSYLSDVGYEQYEVSNFSFPGYACKHNLKYWQLQSTIGLGPSAHSFFMGKRYCNAKDFNKYITSVPKKLPKQAVSHKDWNDFVSARFRCLSPISFSYVKKQYNINIPTQFESDIAHLSAANFIRVTDKTIVITPTGTPLLDDIVCCFLQ
jgi:oxygen-independent coproporphyrinogen III oxidase